MGYLLGSLNILVDRHHAGLLHSLQLLFEDRLKMNLYVTAGREWWDEGYWAFGKSAWGDDRLAHQFLVSGSGTPGWDRDPLNLYGGDYIDWDQEFPDRYIAGVSVARAREMPWAFVLASVPDNYAGFHRFAQEHGAKFIIQVGNHGQYIDWGLDPIVLASVGKGQIQGPGNVTIYHQEFDSEWGAYRFSEPEHSNPQLVGSFVNLMPRQNGWDFLTRTREQLPEFTFKIHGIDGPDGKVVPTGAIGAVMANCGWGWHDKNGDGFGHVIHNWASVGRPLVGRASTYQGCLAESFWEDGVTSVNIDGRKPDEVARILREISLDKDRHAEMCHRIRDKFVTLVDWEKEAAEISVALGLTSS